MKMLITSALLVAGSTAFAAPQLKVVTSGVTAEGLFGPWSSVCVDNTELTQDIQVQYRYGNDGDWTTASIPQNTTMMFSQKYDSEAGPQAFNLQFMDAVGGTELGYTLDETETRVRPYRCDAVTNYTFKGTDGATVYLVKVQ